MWKELAKQLQKPTTSFIRVGVGQVQFGNYSNGSFVSIIALTGLYVFRINAL
jgi:hypothetical protein